MKTLNLSIENIAHLQSGPALFVSDPEYCCDIRPSVNPKKGKEELGWSMHLTIKGKSFTESFSSFVSAVIRANEMLEEYGVKKDRQLKRETL
jgi:hypothetical protein